ncbi:MAG: 2-dehydropantoate 2-reductase [Candidatus Sumerlaeaceae bacterium]
MAEAFKGRIGVIGAGALGAFYGARLARAGHDVHFLMRRDYEAVSSNGLHVKSFEGDFVLHPPVYDAAEKLGRCDLLLIGLKSGDNAALPALLEPTADAKTLVLTLQNGLGNEERIAEVLGGENASGRVLGGIAFLCSNRIAPGVIHHIDHGWIRLGEFRGTAQPRTHAIGAMFESAGVRCQVYNSLLRARWEKLVWNVPFNGLGVEARANVAEVLASPELRQRARHLMNDVITAARSDGVELESELADKMMRNSETMGPYRTSMQIDYEEGRAPETESILGEPLRRAQNAGLHTPYLESLYTAAAVACGRLTPGP